MVHDVHLIVRLFVVVVIDVAKDAVDGLLMLRGVHDGKTSEAQRLGV